MKVFIQAFFFVVAVAKAYLDKEFDLLENKSLEYVNGSQSLVNESVAKPCSCRQRCFVQPWCMAFSLHRQTGEENAWSCRLFLNETREHSENPTKYRLVNSPNTILGARSVHPHIRLEGDGFYYTFREQHFKGDYKWDELMNSSRSFCEDNFPSFKLAVINSNDSRTVSQRYSTYNKNPVFIDMWKMHDTDIFIGPSNTRLDATELCDFKPVCDFFITKNVKEEVEVYGLKDGEIFTLLYGKDSDTHELNLRASLLCQANYLGLDPKPEKAPDTNEPRVQSEMLSESREKFK